MPFTQLFPNPRTLHLLWLSALWFGLIGTPGWATAQQWENRTPPEVTEAQTFTVPVSDAILVPERLQGLMTRCFLALNDEQILFDSCRESLEQLNVAARSDQTAIINKAQITAAIGSLHLRKGDLAQARTFLEEARQLAPADAIVQGNYANLLVRQGQFAAAIEAYNAVLTTAELDRRSTAALYLNRALALRAIGRYDEESKDFALYQELTETPVPSTTTDKSAANAFLNQ
jgi:tetratricopeptide (TPR) repeat protein